MAAMTKRIELSYTSRLEPPASRLRLFPPSAQRIHEVDREAEVGLPVADELQARIVQRALRIQHLEVRRVAVLVAKLREVQRLFGLRDEVPQLRIRLVGAAHVGKRIGDIAE